MVVGFMDCYFPVREGGFHGISAARESGVGHRDLLRRGGTAFFSARVKEREEKKMARKVYERERGSRLG